MRHFEGFCAIPEMFFCFYLKVICSINLFNLRCENLNIAYISFACFQFCYKVLNLSSCFRRVAKCFACKLNKRWFESFGSFLSFISLGTLTKVNLSCMMEHNGFVYLSETKDKNHLMVWHYGQIEGCHMWCFNISVLLQLISKSLPEFLCLNVYFPFYFKGLRAMRIGFVMLLCFTGEVKNLALHWHLYTTTLFVQDVINQNKVF